MCDNNKTTRKPMESSGMNTLERNAFGQRSRVLGPPVRNREMDPFGQSKRTPRCLVNRESSGLLTSERERSRNDPTASISGVLVNSKTRLGAWSICWRMEKGDPSTS